MASYTILEAVTKRLHMSSIPFSIIIIELIYCHF